MEHCKQQAANVHKSALANKTSVYIVRTFVRLREMKLTNEKLARKVDQKVIADPQCIRPAG